MASSFVVVVAAAGAAARRSLPVAVVYCLLVGMTVLQMASAVPVPPTEVAGKTDEAIKIHKNTVSQEAPVLNKQNAPSQSAAVVRIPSTPDAAKNRPATAADERGSRPDGSTKAAVKDTSSAGKSPAALSRPSTYLAKEQPKEEKEEAGGTAQELAVNGEETSLPWQYDLSDPRLEELLTGLAEQQRFNSEPGSRSGYGSSQEIIPPALADYLLRTGQMERTLEDLVSAGAISEKDADAYREAIGLYYAEAIRQEYNNRMNRALSPEMIRYYNAEAAEADRPLEQQQQSLPMDYPEYFVPEEAEEEEPSEGMEGNYDGRPSSRNDDYYSQQQPSLGGDDGEREEARNELLRSILENIAVQDDEEREQERREEREQERREEREQDREAEELPTSFLTEDEKATPSASPAVNELKDAGSFLEKELESLPASTDKNARRQSATTAEEDELNEMLSRMRSQKTKQDNRTKPVKSSQ